jgi:hypothetical protein
MVDIVDTKQIVAEITRYETELAGVLSRFTRGHDSARAMIQSFDSMCRS